MRKPEFPPLLEPGLTEVTLDDLGRLCADSFPGSKNRGYLVMRLREFVTVLQEISLDCDLWINGSFLTEEPEPSDIDVVIWSDEDSRSRLTVSQGTRLRKIIEKKDLTMY